MDGKIVLSLSGGKDSTAMYLLALEQGLDFVPVFADTGHEHPITVEYVDALPGKTGGPEVRTVKADFAGKFPKKRQTIRDKWPLEGVPPHVVERALDACKPTGNPFLDICILNAGFPSAWSRFCTDNLKIRPIEDQVYGPLLREGVDVESWQGVRAGESFARSTLEERQALVPPRRLKAKGKLSVYRPLLRWSVADVWRQHRRHGLEPNPLYAMGAVRVGCMPCVFANKRGVRVVAERHPEHIERVEEWERLVGAASKNDPPKATLFPYKGHGRKGIRAVAEWSRTERGGKTVSLIPLEEVRPDLLESCGAWGACE